MKNKLRIILLMCISSTLFAFEKVGVTSFQFLKILPDARSNSLGCAYSSISQGADGMYWNPAALVMKEGLSIDFSRVNYIFDTGHYSGALSYNLGSISLGAMFMAADYGKIEVTEVSALGFQADGTYNPGLTGETISPGAAVFGIGFSQKLTNKFQYGVAAKYAREDMVVAEESVLMWDMGILYDTEFKSLKIAATMRNFGPQVKYFEYEYPLPQTLNVGISACIIGETALLATSTNHRLLMAFDLVQPRDFDQQYNIGMEYVFLKMVALRTGYKINYDSEGLTLGAGIQFKNFGLDYAYNNFGDFLEDVHRFSFSINR
ncbi:MAG: PorV/PorQ family protein [Candidatus Marinimicrobia bacterium]|nr:PorV/PorQ family protein [Candidatus Neomarinimicrobiota bacterium]